MTSPKSHLTLSVSCAQVHFQSWGRDFDCVNKTFDDREALVADAVRR